MKSILTAIVMLGLGVLSLVVRSRAESKENHDDSIKPKVDALFDHWNKPDCPGMVCAVMQDGEIIYEKGFGMADLEHDEPLSPDSVFYIASTSKQFTAATIALLSL